MVLNSELFAGQNMHLKFKKLIIKPSQEQFITCLFDHLNKAVNNPVKVEESAYGSSETCITAHVDRPITVMMEKRDSLRLNTRQTQSDL